MIIDGTSPLKFEFINEVPWDKSPAFAFSSDTQAYLDAFKNAVSVLPTKDLKITFKDDIWDFNPYFKDVQSQEYKFNFSNLPDDLAEYCKFFVLHKISGKTKISTTYVRYSQFASIVLNIFDRTSHKDIQVVTTEDVQNEINRRNAAPSTVHNLYQAAYQVYYFLIKHYRLNLPVELDVLNKESVKWKNIDKQNNTKLSDIPEAYFNAILKKSLAVMRNKKADNDERMMGSAIVFISQTGLRLGDFLALTTDSIFSKVLSKSGNTVNYVHFTERKPSKAHQPLLEFDIFCNRFGTEAFNIMTELRKSSALSKGNKFLFAPSSRTNKGGIAEVPCNKIRFRSMYQRFLYANLPTESTTDWEGISPYRYHINKYAEKKGTASAITLYVPDTRQFRVHLCTVLYNQGVPLIYIQKYMGHLSDYMMGYYVRPKDTYQENIQYSEKVIREIAGEDVTPLGGNRLGKDIKENIKKFITDNGFNVQADMEAIIKALGDKVVIRAKTGGVCIKTSLMPCAKDARTNEMMCAYNLCPNLFHFYYMVDISYMNFRTLIDTYYAMKDSGKTKAAQKELSKMRDLINRRLIPELDELDKEIATHGFDVILDRHPSLLDIMTDREEIRKEIESWRMKH
jgi:hypothetical protein